MLLLKKSVISALFCLGIIITAPVFAEEVPVIDANQEPASPAPAAPAAAPSQAKNAPMTDTSAMYASVSAQQSTEQRVSQLERELSNRNQVDLLSQINRLEQQVQELRGQLEIQNHDLKLVQDQQRTQYADIDQRFNKMVSTTASASSAVIPPKKKSAATKSDTANSADNNDSKIKLASADKNSTSDSANNSKDNREAYYDPKQQQAYLVGYNLLKNKKYEQAKTSLQGFLAQYPKGTYSTNAHYWLGEIALLQAKPDEAIYEFNKVITDNPPKEKLAEAMLKLGYAYYDKNSWQQAKTQLDKVKQQFSGTSAAKLASVRLQEMKQQDHQETKQKD